MLNPSRYKSQYQPQYESPATHRYFHYPYTPTRTHAIKQQRRAVRWEKMARSVLGKRSRSVIDVQDASPSTPTRKRRTRAPIIHKDDDAVAITHHSQQDAPQAMELDGPLRSPQRRESLSKAGVASAKWTTLTPRKALSPIKANVQKTPEDSVKSDDLALPTYSALSKSNGFFDQLSENAPATPKHRVKVLTKPLSTPQTNRHIATPTSRSRTVYSAARQLFAQGSSPDKLVGRDQERNQLKAFIAGAAEAGCGGCLYISGPPGTGKSALVEEVLSDMTAHEDLVSSTVNCIGFKAAKEVFSKLVQDFCVPGTSAIKAEKALASIFAPKKASGKKFIVMLDEIDHLLATDLEALYSLFEWSLRPASNLTLIGIANALDLTDRFLPRLKARNLKPQLLSFRPYTAPQIASIITSRLQSLMPSNSASSTPYTPFLHPAAVQLCSKKVASQTGDLRKAFNIVCRAVDLIERETIETKPQALNDQQFMPLTPPKSSPLKPLSPSSSPNTTPTKPSQTPLSHLTPSTAPRATIAHLARITSTIFNSSSTGARLSALNLQQKAVLCSLLAAEKRRARRIADPFSTPTKAGKLPPSVADLWSTYRNLCTRDDVLQPLTRTEFADVVGSLEGLGLMGESQGKAGMTPTKTPTRKGRMADGAWGMGFGGEEKRVVCGVSEKEMEMELGRGGAGAEILKGLLSGE
ncbi:MAG: hypothetical protein Q9160_004272 [Pyrenula sp. 1 TL-2023]